VDLFEFHGKEFQFIGTFWLPSINYKSAVVHSASKFLMVKWVPNRAAQLIIFEQENLSSSLGTVIKP
jgi:hypothetical protein